MEQLQNKDGPFQQKITQPREAHLRDYLPIILKHRWIVLASFFSILLATVFYTFTTEPIYRATAQLLIQKEQPSILTHDGVSSYSGNDSAFYNTQLRILKSSPLAKEVIRKLDLLHHPEFQKSDAENTHTDGSSEKINGYDEIPNSIVTSFLNNITISPEKDSYVVLLNAKSKYPDLAAKIANTLAVSYIEMQVNKRTESSLGKEGWLQDQLNKQEKQVESAELALQNYMESSGVFSSDYTENESLAYKRLAMLDEELQSVEFERVRLQQIYDQIIESGDDLESILSNPGIIDNANVAILQKQLVENDKEMAIASVSMGPKHPSMLRLQKERDSLTQSLNNLVNSIKDSYKKKYLAVLAKEKSLRDAVEKQRQKILTQNEKAIQYEIMHREVETSREIYDILLRRARETKVESNSSGQVINIEIIEKAEAPANPIKPNKKRNIILGLLLGLVISLSLAIFIEYLDNSISSSEDVKSNYDLPVLGMIPRLETNKEENDYEDHNDLFISNEHFGNLGEAFRVIRSSLMLFTPSVKCRKILVTSADVQEGKSFAAANLAVVMAQNSLKTLIIDGDMRKPRLHRIFNASKEKGFSNLLVDNDDPLSPVVPTEIENLDLLPSGPIPPNPADLLSSPRAGEIFARLEEYYECIVIDSPPLMRVSDPLPLSLNADLALIMIKLDKTKKDLFTQALERLRSANDGLPLGAILNQMESFKSYYSYYNYYYNYNYEGDTEDKLGGETSKKHIPSRKSSNTNIESFINIRNGLLTLAVIILLSLTALGVKLISGSDQKLSSKPENGYSMKTNPDLQQPEVIEAAHPTTTIAPNSSTPVSLTASNLPGHGFENNNENKDFPKWDATWENQNLVISLNLGRPISNHKRDFILSDPKRIIIDIPSAKLPDGCETIFNIPQNPLISQVRFGEHDDYVRFVFDAKPNADPRYKLDWSRENLIITIFSQK